MFKILNSITRFDTVTPRRFPGLRSWAHSSTLRGYNQVNVAIENVQ